MVPTFMGAQFAGGKSVGAKIAGCQTCKVQSLQCAEFTLCRVREGPSL